MWNRPAWQGCCDQDRRNPHADLHDPRTDSPPWSSCSATLTARSMVRGSQPNSAAAQSLTISSRTRSRSFTVTTAFTVGRFVTGRQGATSQTKDLSTCLRSPTGHTARDEGRSDSAVVDATGVGLVLSFADDAPSLYSAYRLVDVDGRRRWSIPQTRRRSRVRSRSGAARRSRMISSSRGMNCDLRGARSTPRDKGRDRSGTPASAFVQVGRVGFEPTKAEPADLQSAPVVRLGTDPRGADDTGSRTDRGIRCGVSKRGARRDADL